jgi:hypothetical protein
MKKVYQIIHLLKLQILSSIFNHVSVKSPGFPIFLALIMFLAMPFLVAQEYRVPATPTTPFESTKDSFGVYIPEGWAIHDLNNTGSMLIQESRQGYGILAQLCLVEQEEEGRQQQEQGSLINASTTGSCQQQQQAQEEIIHIIRYPNLGARLGIAVSDIRDMIPDSILQYEIQKLQELGYRDINVISSVDTKMIVYNPGASGILATVPARIVEMIYSTDSAPNEIRRGHLYLTATNATPPSLETITGYSMFYEAAAAATTVRPEEITRSESLPRLSPEVVQILNSFGPIPSQEIVQFTFHARAQQAAVSNQTDDAGEEPGQSTSATRYLDSTIVMLIVYSLLVIGVVWKFISYMRENHSSRLDVIS